MLKNRILFLTLLTLPITLSYVMAMVPTQGVPLDGPAHWVGFHGSFTDSAPPGEQPVTGEYFQASNGSTRLDSSRQTTKGLVVWTTIVNTVLNRRFILDPGKSKWDSYPLEPRKAGWDRPLNFSSALSKGDGPAFQGMRTIRIESSDIEQLVVPDLNFFPIWQRRAGQERTYSNIEVGDPESTRFEPPPGAEVAVHTELQPKRSLRR